MDEINVIDVWPSVEKCILCGIETKLGYSVPMYEGKIVDTSKTDDWAGFVVCESCHDKVYTHSKKR